MTIDALEIISNLDLNGLLDQSKLLKEINKIRGDTGKLLTIPVNVFLKIMSEDIISSIGKKINFDIEDTGKSLDLYQIFTNTGGDYDDYFLNNIKEKEILLNFFNKIFVFFLFFEDKEEKKLEFLKYINKKIRFKVKTITKKERNGYQEKTIKYSRLDINLNDFFLSKEKLIKHLSVFIPFIKDYKIFLGDDIEVPENIQITKKISIQDLIEALKFLSDLFINKNLFSSFSAYLKNILEVLYIYVKELLYEDFILIDNYFDEIRFDDFENINSELFNYLYAFNNDLESDNLTSKSLSSLNNFGSFFVLIVYGMEKMSSINSNNIEIDIFGGGFNKYFLKKIKNSKIKEEFENIKSLDKRRIILEIISKKYKLFLSRKDIPFNKLFSYLTGELNDEKYKKISYFFGDNITYFEEEEYLFIFENDLEDSLILKNKNFLKQSIKWKKNGILLNDIKELTTKDFEVLSQIEDINELKFLIKNFLKNNNNNYYYLEFLRIKKELKNDLNLLHEFTNGYIELEDLSKIGFKDIGSIHEFISEISDIYNDFNFKSIINRNKRLLIGVNNNIEDLNELYIIFNLLNCNELEELLIEIFLLNIKDFEYIKIVVSKIRGNKEDYERLLKGGYIKFITNHKDLVDLYLEDIDKNIITFEFLLNEIDEEKGFKIIEKKAKKAKENNIYLKLNGLYSEEELSYIKERFNDKEIINFLEKIGNILNGYKKSFIIWLKSNGNIDIKTLKNIFYILHFFDTRNIKSFNRIKKIFKIILDLNGDLTRLELIEEKFKGFFNIENPEEFKSIILKFLKNGDLNLIDNYIFKNFKNITVVPNNNQDTYILSILNFGNEEEKEKLGKQLSQIVRLIIENFDPGILSSTKNKNSGVGTGSSTKVLKQYLLRKLLKNNNETYIEYLYRVYRINWKQIITSIISKHRGRKKVQNLYDITIDGDFLFFEAFEKFSEIINNFEKIDGHVDISNLLDIFNTLLNSLIYKFNKEFNL